MRYPKTLRTLGRSLCGEEYRYSRAMSCGVSRFDSRRTGFCHGTKRGYRRVATHGESWRPIKRTPVHRGILMRPFTWKGLFLPLIHSRSSRLPLSSAWISLISDSDWCVFSHRESARYIEELSVSFLYRTYRINTHINNIINQK